MTLNSINYDERVFKNTEFSSLDNGKKFYTGRPRSDSIGLEYTKIATTKNINGAWVNAKNSLGLTIFVPYDKKVVILESK